MACCPSAILLFSWTLGTYKMTLISKALSSLTGGVSQQSPSLRLYNQCEEQENFRSSLVNGLQSRRPLELINEAPAGDYAFYPIDRDEDGKYNLLINSTGVKVYSVEGDAQTVAVDGGLDAYLNAPAGQDPYQSYKVLTLADHTFILNTNTTVRLLSQTYTPWKNQALVFIKQVQASTTWSLTINGQTISVGYGGVNNESGLPHLYVNGILAQQNVNMSTSDIATRLSGGSPAHTYYVQTTDTVYNSDKTYYFHFNGSYHEITTAALWASYKEKNNVYERVDIAATSGFSGFTITQSASTLWIRKNDGGAFSIGLSDTRSDTCSYLVTSKVQQFSDLPTVAPDGYICRVVGSIASNADDYYVMFVTNSGTSFGKGVWEECAEPGSSFGLDPATMPWKLVHKADGTWQISKVAWKEKLTGDLDSSPNPSFVDKKLRNIFLFANRLCFLTEDLLCMSAAADYENFWNETATTLTDADPIFISASTDSVADLYDFGIQDDELIVFGSHDQFKLSSPDVLSPKTCALNSVASNAYARNTGVVSAGSRLYFGHKKGNYYSVCEFGTSAYTGSKEATVITSHVPNYIPFLDRLHVCGTENANALTVVSDSTPDVLYIYQYYIAGTNKLQAAWHKYTFKNTQIKGAFYRENLLWLFMIKGGTGFITTLDMSEYMQGLDNRPCLDLLTDYEGEATAEYDIPAWYDTSNIMALTRLASGVLQIVEIKEANGSHITLAKAVDNLLIGEKYNRRYLFSTPYITQKDRSGSEKAITTGRWQLQTLTLRYDDSGPFTVTVKPSYDDNAEGYQYQFSGIRVGTQTAIIGRTPIDSGEMSIPIRMRNTEARVQVDSDSHLPQAFISASWQGNYITKVRQI